ncbi:hypothetical protein EXIGLDRAFT_756055 [Exidia glandulosa HHB12029]|uniref:Uncharacterized protein n=1 Tax=Exidia glandulosa HHB12029 TaxID=1314781 RepID=A0A165BK20_EXIGL|nr:hypothetical protein EXIGLDRAFT_756055 [Exidia glandulosa HHB12029]
MCGITADPATAFYFIASVASNPSWCVASGDGIAIRRFKVMNHIPANPVRKLSASPSQPPFPFRLSSVKRAQQTRQSCKDLDENEADEGPGTNWAKQANVIYLTLGHVLILDNAIGAFFFLLMQSLYLAIAMLRSIMPLLQRITPIITRGLPQLRRMANISLAPDEPVAPEYMNLFADLDSTATDEGRVAARARFQVSLDNHIQRTVDIAVGKAKTELEKKFSSTNQAYGAATRGIFHKTGGLSLACADFLFQAGQVSQVVLEQMLDILTRLRVLSYDTQSPPSPPAPGIAAYTLTRDLMARRRPSGPGRNAVNRYTIELANIQALIPNRSPEGLAYWPLLWPNGQLRLERNIGAHELKIREWLIIAENELAVAHEIGHDLLALFEKVFSCSIQDARNVLGSAFVDDPKNILFYPYDDADADEAAGAYDALTRLPV